MPTLEEYQKSLKDTPYFYVAEDKETIIGFLAAFTNQSLNKYQPQNEIINHILTKEKPFLYIDQLATVEEYRRQKVSYQLLKRLTEDIAGQDFKAIWGVVVSSPHKNQPIINLITRLGAKLIEEITFSNNLTFGFYKKDLKRIITKKYVSKL